MATIRFAILGCLLLAPAFGAGARAEPPEHGYHARCVETSSSRCALSALAPTPQIQFDVVVAPLQLPKAEQEHILKAVAKSWIRSKKCQLAQHGCVVWTANDCEPTITTLHRLRDREMAKFLACPRLVTMVGKPATFQSGGQLAVPTPSADHEQCSVEYENFGTQFSFTASAIKDGKLVLSMNLTQSDVAQKEPHLTLAEHGVKTFAQLAPGQWAFILIPAAHAHTAGHPETHVLFMVCPRVVNQP